MHNWSSTARWMLLPWGIVSLYFAASVWLTAVTAGGASGAAMQSSLLMSLAQFWPWTFVTPVIVLAAGRWRTPQPRRRGAPVAQICVGVLPGSQVAGARHAS